MRIIRKKFNSGRLKWFWIVLPLLVFIFSLPVFARAAGLISYWHLDELAGPDYADAYSGLDGVCVTNCPIPSDGKVNGGQDFNGIDTGIDVAADPFFDWDTAESFSIEFWVKGIPGQTCMDSDEAIIGRTDNQTPMQWQLGCANATGTVQFILGDTNGISTTLESSTGITDGVWHHIVAVRDHLSGLNRLYVDGIEADFEAIIYSGSFSSSANLNIGWLNSGDGLNFNGTIDEPALYNGVLSEKEIRTHYYLGRSYTESCDKPIKIMPLGDSITYGSGTSPPTGYRQPLYLDLTQTGLPVDFVGSRQHGQTASPAFDYDHEGYPGWRDHEIADNVFSWLSVNPAEVVLLHIGTNDISADPLDTDTLDVERILDEIDRFDENITVILARIINRASYPDSLQSQKTTEFNANIQNMADARIANGDKIIVVDHENALVYPDDLVDSVHPNYAGYAKMSDVWLFALDDFLPGCADIPRIISTPVLLGIVGGTYSYTVVATGDPVPTYDLVSAPDGMTMDPINGTISWTPSESGNFPVTVEAVNGNGTDIQTYAVTIVADLGPTQRYLEFDGVNDFVSVPDTGELDLTAGQLTISAWINPSGWGQNSQGRIIDNGGGSSGNMGWSLHVDNKNPVGAASLRFQVNNDFSFNNRSDLDVIRLDEWQHVAVTVDGGTLTFYVNGVVRGVRSGVPLPLARSTAVRIGLRSTDGNRAFAGSIDEVCIWDQALSQQEILGTMAVELSGSEPGLIGYFQFNEGAGQTASDSSDSGNDGQLGSGSTADSADPVWVISDTSANQAPAVDAGAAQEITLPTDTVNLDGTVTDDGLPGGELTSTWSVVSGPGTVTFGDVNVVDTSATFSAEGSYILRLTADDTELTASDEVTVTVNPEPDTTPPTVSVSFPANGQTVSGSVTISADASDNAAVDYVEFQVNSTILGTDATAPYALSWDTTTVANGPYTITAFAVDTATNQASASVGVTVDNGAPVNQAPGVDAGSNQNIILPTDTVNLDGTVTDDGLPGGELTSTWSVVSGPGTVTFGDINVVDTSATFSAEGSYILRLTADDTELNASDEVTVTVNPEPDTTPPTVSVSFPANGQTVSGSVTISADASDNAAVDYVEFQVNSTILGTDATAPYALSWDTTTVANGPYTITAFAVDSSTNQASASVGVTVDNGAPVNQAPGVDAGSNQNIILPTDTIDLDGTVTDDGLPGGELTSTWSVVSGPGTVTFGDINVVDTSATFSAEGSYILQLTATDTELTASDEMTVTVGSEPVLTQIAVTPAQENLAVGATHQFSASGVDQYGGSIAINPIWTATGGSIDAGGLYTAGDIGGQYTVTATDDGISGQALVTISESAPAQSYLEFDGVDDQVNIADNGALDLTAGQLTISAWINPSGWGQNSQGRIIDNGGGSSGNMGWSLHVDNKNPVGAASLRFQVNNDFSFNNQSDLGVIILDEWQHVAVTVDGGTLTFYVNGVARGVRSGVPLPLARSTPVRIGKRSTDANRAFAGAIDEVCIWDRALSQQEILDTMAVELSGSEPGLIGYFQFNEGAGQTASDSSISSNDGQLGSGSTADSADPVWVISDAPANQAPAVDAGAAQEITLPTDTVNLDGTVTDDGLPAGELTSTWSVVSGPGTVTFGDVNVVDTSATFSTEGSYVLRLTATDTDLSASDQVTVTVNPEPDTTPPTVSVSFPANGQTVSGSVTISADASDNAAVDYVEFQVNSTILGTDATAPYALSWDTTTVANGPYTITAFAVDSSTNQASASVGVTVDNGAPVNQAPGVDAGSNQNIILPTDTVNLDGTVTDDGLPGGELTSTWSVVSGPGTVTFGDVNVVDTSATFSAEGSYILQLTATDTELTASDEMTVTVGSEPVLTQIAVTPAQENLAVGATHQFSASGVDQYGGSIAINPIWTATGGSIDAGGLYTAGDIGGQYTVTATDDGISGQALVTISESAPAQSYLEFDGVDDQVNIADNGALDLTAGQLTISAWINPSGWGQNSQGRIIDNGGGSSGNMGWSLHVDNKNPVGAASLRFQVNNDFSFNNRSDLDVIRLDEWQHVAVTVDGGTLTFYVNGVVRGVRSGVPLPLARSTAVRIGLRSTDGNRAFAGSIDEVCIWDQALSQQEILGTMAVELSGSEPGLIGYFQFNEGTGQTASDSSDSGNDGQLGSGSTADSADPIWITE